MTNKELLEIIDKGENFYVEFKEEEIKAKELGEEFIAFANSEGGTVIIGISDDGKIKGIREDKLEEKIMNICRNNCIPNIVPIYEESKEMVERTLINADILKEFNEKIVCSIGGMLVFGKEPANILPQNGINFAHFKGKEITDELIDKKVIVGRIQDIAEQLLVVLKNNIKTPSIISDMKREEKAEYPLLVLREAIVNSLVHRNYSIVGSKIRIFMFDDRLNPPSTCLL